MEEIQFNIYGILGLFGVFQGLILALIFAFHKSFAKKSNWFLSLLLFSLSLANFLGAIEETHLYESYPILILLPLFWTGLIAPLTYFFIKFLTNSNYKIKSWEYLLFLSFISEIIFRLYFLIQYQANHFDLNSDLDNYYDIRRIFDLIDATVGFIVLINAVQTLKRYEQQLLGNYSDISDKSLKWLRNVLVGGSALCLIWFYFSVTSFFSMSYVHHDRILWTGISILIYWIGYGILMQRELFVNETITAIEEIPEKTSKLSKKTEDYYQNLLVAIEEKELFRNPDLNMTLLAKEVGLSKGYLSQIINEKEEKNFFNLINSYRVEYVKQRMNDPKFSHYSILGIALEAGFKSKSTFNSVFKKMTGMTPTQFKKSKN